MPDLFHPAFWIGLGITCLVGGILCFFTARRFFIIPLRKANGRIHDLQQQLRQYEQRVSHDKDELKAILSSMVEGVIVVGANEKILYASPNVSQMLEARSKDITHKSYWEVIRHQGINASLKEALLDAKAVAKEVVLIGLEDVYFNMQISPVVEEGKLTSVVAVFHDITELKKLLRLRSEFVANVSHELKTPLTSIKGFVETLREGGMDDPANAKRFLDIINRQTVHLEQLVDDLLTLSAIESKEVKMDMRKQDLAPIVQSVLMMQKKAADKANVHIATDIPDNVPKVYVDRRRVEQVFINLIDNAIKFTPAQGHIEITARQEGSFVRVDVKDSGIGIAPQHLTRIFERFYRADPARSRESGGTGLGLSIVKHILNAHHGKIEVQSAPGAGCTFAVFLPFTE